MSRVLSVVLWGRSAARVHRVHRVQKVQRVVVAPCGRNIIIHKK